MTDDIDEWADRFSQHLNECEQCRRHPFDLCDEGQRLLEAAPEGIVEKG